MTKKTYTLEEIAKHTNATLSCDDPSYSIAGVSDLEHASEHEISFLGNTRYLHTMQQSKAGAIFIDGETAQNPGQRYLIVETPSLAFQQVIELFYAETYSEITGFQGVHPTAVVHPTAKIGEGTTIGPYAVIDKDASIGDHTTINAHCYVGLGTTIGNHCLLHPHVVIRERCEIKDSVILQPGAIIGSCGFGYIQSPKGEHIKLNHIGNVVIDSDVEVGANTTIDRARFQSTHIKQGSKIDNLVQIAHNVSIGAHNIIVAQTGIAGSTSTGSYVLIGGQAALDGHLTIADKTRISARAGVTKSLREGTYGGAPALPIKDFNRNIVLMRNISKYVQHLKDFEKKVEELEELANEVKAQKRRRWW